MRFIRHTTTSAQSISESSAKTPFHCVACPISFSYVESIRDKIERSQWLIRWRGATNARLIQIKLCQFLQEHRHTLTLTFIVARVGNVMRMQQVPDASLSIFRFNTETGDFVAEKDWDQFENCKQCRGRAEIDEMPEGDLVCQVCRAALPKPST